MKILRELMERWRAYSYITDGTDFSDGASAQLAECAAELAAALDALWVSVKDGLPDGPEPGYSEDVLVCNAEGFRWIGNYCRPLKGSGFWNTGRGPIIKWMPLPEPPKEKP